MLTQSFPHTSYLYSLPAQCLDSEFVYSAHLYNRYFHANKDLFNQSFWQKTAAILKADLIL